MANDLRIKITGTLNQTTSLVEINKAISQLEKKINKIKINVDISQETTNALNNLNNQIRNLGSNGFTNATRPVSSQINNIGNAAHTATQHTLTFGSALRQAYAGFTLWAATAQLVYAPVRALESMTQRLIQIDTQMTEIKRVMTASPEQFNKMLEDAVNTSDQLSSKLTDVLTIMGNFARNGNYSESQLVNMTKTAQVLQNISDLDAQSSVDTLTAAMANFNINAKDSIQIADKLNEVDNHYAITTKDLADGIRKAGATAHTFGVTLDDLNGYIAAIGTTTRESGSIIGNGKLFAA